MTTTLAERGSRPVTASIERPILLIGLDGAAWSVLDPLLQLGDLPTLRQLIDRGAHGTMSSTIPPITPAAWASFMTGTRPGKHGIYDFRVYDPHTYRDTFVTRQALGRVTMWELLRSAGRRVGVVNLPVMYPPDAAMGTIVSGFDTPSTSAPFTSPPELRERILAQMPDYFFGVAPDPADPALLHDGPFEQFLEQVKRDFEQRTGVALALLADGPWDVFMVHFQAIDALQHVLWRVVAEPAADPRRWDRVREIYRYLDRSIAQLLRASPPATLVVALSDHGFGSHLGRLYPNALLRSWGYLVRTKRPKPRHRALHKWLGRLGVRRYRDKRAPFDWMGQVRAETIEAILRADWKRTRAYVAAAEQYGLLYVNLRGREPEGIVEPGADQRQLLKELRARLTAVCDPHDDAPAFADILDGTEVYPQDPLGRRPDLVLVPRTGYSVSRQVAPPDWWAQREPVLNGTHRAEGLVIVAGDGVRPGSLPEAVELMDVAPTVLAAAGVGIPEDMDGRSLTQLFTTPPPVVLTTPAGPLRRDHTLLGATEEEAVAARLRALGYLA
jgi:predicted AlkP superfamily phosphohydrolase/phosphomutase